MSLLNSAIICLLINTGCSKQATPEPVVREGGVDGTPLHMVPGQDPDVIAFHHTELVLEHRVDPSYPTKAIDLRLGSQVCRVQVFIDHSGVPYDAVPGHCPQVFYDEARSCVLQWRWQPAVVDHRPVKAQVLIELPFNVE